MFLCFPPGSIDLTGIENQVHWDELFTLPKDYWLEDHAETCKFLDAECGDDLPPKIKEQLDKQTKRLANLK